ncbi:hypothetical protein DFH27DRAFT_589384 [Peziza echinospora]|nr:hypothetical protein DFH27DRAFT_589384 [Peziza echinospora]
MFVKNLILSTLAVAGLAAAQTNTACSASNNTIAGNGDLQKIASCKTLSGDLIIGVDVTIVELNVEQIQGSFIVEGASTLSKINLPNLKSIGNLFSLKRLTVLDTLSAPMLTSVGSIEWITLPQLVALSFNSKITTAANVRISDTQLGSLEGIDLQTVKKFNVDNNKYLKSVTFGLKNVSEALSMEFNSKSIAINFPSLVWARNITLIDAGSIELPSLQYVNGSINFGNNSVETIACKNLTTVEQTIAFIGNPKLTKLDFPVLKDVGGGFKIHNNTLLAVIDGFPKLTTVKGAIDIVGNLKNATLPELEDVQGGFNLQTSEQFDCKEFDKYQADKVIKGDDYVCKGQLKNPTTKDGKSGGEGNGNGTSGDSAASALAGNSIFGLSAVAALSAVVALVL